MQIKVRKGQLPILACSLLLLVAFSTHFLTKKNGEFLLYAGVILFFLIVFIITNSKVYYPNTLLWALWTWALMHLSGGAFHIQGKLLYEIILIPLSEKYPVFRYDQLVHIVGFATATVTMYYVLKPLLRRDIKAWTSLSIVVGCAGLGIGAFNEIVEFLATVLLPQTNVGGYLNTSLDLVADFIGAIIAVFVIRLFAGRHPAPHAPFENQG
jgi:putative membrane protein